MTGIANFAFDLMVLFFAFLALVSVVILCGLPTIFRAFDAYLAKLNSLN